MTQPCRDGAGETVFLSVPPYSFEESRALSPMWSSTTLFSNNRRVPARASLGGLEQAQAISIWLPARVENSSAPNRRRRTRFLRLNNRLEAFLPPLPAHPVNHRALVSRALMIRCHPAFTVFDHILQQYSRLKHPLAGSSFSYHASSRRVPSPLSRTTYFFNRNLLRSP